MHCISFSIKLAALLHLISQFKQQQVQFMYKCFSTSLKTCLQILLLTVLSCHPHQPMIDCAKSCFPLIVRLWLADNSGTLAPFVAKVTAIAGGALHMNLRGGGVGWCKFSWKRKESKMTRWKEQRLLCVKSSFLCHWQINGYKLLSSIVSLIYWSLWNPKSELLCFCGALEDWQRHGNYLNAIIWRHPRSEQRKVLVAKPTATSRWQLTFTCHVKGGVECDKFPELNVFRK